jgi:protein O-mannosyl-transferase
MRTTVQCGLLFAVGLLLAYFPALSGDWVWDDGAWTSEITPLHADLRGLASMWFSATALQQYFPVTGTSFWIDQQLWGTWTLPYHVENVLLHALSAALLGHLLSRLQISAAWFIATLFAFHPLMAESVAWITERKNVLSLALALGSVLCFGRFARLWQVSSQPSGWKWWCLSLLLTAAALLAKISTFIIAPTLLILVWWKRPGIRWPDTLLQIAPFFLITFVFGTLTLWLEKHHVGTPDSNLTATQHFLLACHIPIFYIQKLLWPAGLASFYPQHTLSWIPPLGLLVMVLLLWRYRKSIPRGAWAAAAIYLIALAPVLGLLPVYGMTYTYTSDRWAYIASIPILAGLGWCLSRVVSPTKVRWIATVLIPLFTLLTWQRSQDFTNLHTFWEKALQKCPSCWLPYQEISRLYHDQGRIVEALDLAQQATLLAPGHAPLHANLASLLIQEKHADAALAALLKADELQPHLPGLQRHYGSVWLQKGDVVLAKKHLEAALKEDPDDTDALNNLGCLHLAQSQPDLALPLFQKLLTASPESNIVHLNLAQTYEQLGDYTNSLTSYELALQKTPSSFPLHNDYAWLLATISEEQGGNGSKALQLTGKALQLMDIPRPELLRTIAAAQAASGDFDSALKTVEQALKQYSGEAMAANLLSDQQSYLQKRPLRR